MTPQQYANDIIVKSCKAADGFDESLLNDVLIKSVCENQRTF